MKSISHTHTHSTKKVFNLDKNDLSSSTTNDFLVSCSFILSTTTTIRGWSCYDLLFILYIKFIISLDHHSIHVLIKIPQFHIYFKMCIIDFYRVYPIINNSLSIISYVEN